MSMKVSAPDGVKVSKEWEGAQRGQHGGQLDAHVLAGPPKQL